MSRPFLLIDGYNLMHAAGMARAKYGPGMLEKRRNRFLKYLSGHLPEEQRRRTTVVFDAGNAPSQALTAPPSPSGSGVGGEGWQPVERKAIRGARRSEQNGMEIVFPPPGCDADSLIEEVIADHSAPRQLRVISSDHRLQKAARRRRSKFSDSEDFVLELQRRGPVSQGGDGSVPDSSVRHPKFTGETSARETDAWLEVFGDVPEAAELKSDPTHRAPPSPGEESPSACNGELDELQAEIDKLIEKADEL